MGEILKRNTLRVALQVSFRVLRIIWDEMNFSQKGGTPQGRRV
jgi:hypothetical protein